MIDVITNYLRSSLLGIEVTQEPCQECSQKQTYLSPFIVLSYVRTYSKTLFFPLENFAEPGCFIKIHTDGKVCFFAAQILNRSQETQLKMRSLIGKATIQNESPLPKSFHVPKTEDIEEQTLKVEGKSEKTFTIFHLWLVFLLTVFSLHAHEPYLETLHPHWTQSFEVSNVLHREHSDFWDLILFENSHFGKVLAIDGVIQLTEADEPFYSEMLAHVPLLTHGNASSVLIIGGGDGCILREVLKHPIERVTLVEIDRKVIELAQQFFPELLDGAFDDPRVEIVIQDAAEYVKTSPEKFDVIICDSTDPVGPAQALFSKEFYTNCKCRLNEKGIMVNQNGVPFLQQEELEQSLERRKDLFRVATFYTTAVPTYVGGLMTLGWSSDEEYATAEKTLENRFAFLKGKTKYYNPKMHRAAFALPESIRP